MNAVTGVKLTQDVLQGPQGAQGSSPQVRCQPPGWACSGLGFRLASGECSGCEYQGGEGLNLSGDLPLAWQCLWVLRSGYGCKAAHAFLIGQGAIAGMLTLTSRPWSKQGSEKGPDWLWAEDHIHRSNGGGAGPGGNVSQAPQHDC